MENILTDGHCLSPYTCKRCIVFKQFDGLNFDGLAGKHQKHQNFPPSKFALYSICKNGIHFYLTNNWSGQNRSSRTVSASPVLDVKFHHFSQICND